MLQWKLLSPSPRKMQVRTKRRSVPVKTQYITVYKTPELNQNYSTPYADVQRDSVLQHYTPPHRLNYFSPPTAFSWERVVYCLRPVWDFVIPAYDVTQLVPRKNHALAPRRA
jgi:hypothetical protein